MTNIEEIINRLKKEFGKHCSEEEENRWQFTVKTDFGRKQRVYLWIEERIEPDRDLSRFVCSSPIGAVYKGIDFRNILQHNFKLDIGTIAIDEMENHDGIKVPFLFFKASHLAVTADYPEIWELIIKTGECADKLEREVYGRDEY